MRKKEDMSIAPSDSPLQRFRLEEYLGLLKRRIILINGDINESTIEFLCVQVLKMDKQKSSLPITIVLHSYGGDVYDMGMAVDTLMMAKSEIVTLAGGKCMSAAFDIFLAGKTRYVMPSSILMCHAGSFSLPNDRLPMQLDTSKHMEYLMNTWIQYYAKRTKKDEKFWRGWVAGGRDIFITADMAVEWGVAHGIFKGWK